MDGQTASAASTATFHFLAALLCLWLASERNRDKFWWFVFGGLFGWPAFLVLFIFFDKIKKK